MSKLAEIFGAMFFSFVIGIACSIYNSWLFKDLWNWFIASTFSLPQIGTAMAMGILLVIMWPVSSCLVGVIRVVGAKEEESPVATGIVLQFVLSVVHTLAWVVGLILVRNFI